MNNKVKLIVDGHILKNNLLYPFVNKGGFALLSSRCHGDKDIFIIKVKFAT